MGLVGIESIASLLGLTEPILIIAVARAAIIPVGLIIHLAEEGTP